MNELQIFNSEEFGEIRTVTIDGEPWFCLADICRALELGNVSQVKTRLNQDGVITNEVIDSIGRKQVANFVNEPNMYRLIFQSRKESAERFTDWVTTEILPTIRKTGSYQMKNLSSEMKAILMHDEKLVKIDQRVTSLENTMTIDYGQQKVLGDCVNRVVLEFLGGKNSEAYREIGKKVFSECNRDLKNYFHVNARNNVPKKRFNEAVKYISNWKPCTNTVLLIRAHNSQMSMEM